MKFDINFSGIFARYLRKCKIDMVIVEIEEYTEKLDDLIVKGFDLIKIKHIVPAQVSLDGTIKISERYKLTHSSTHYQDKLHAEIKRLDLEDSVKAVLCLYRIIDEHGKEYYTYQRSLKIEPNNIYNI